MPFTLLDRKESNRGCKPSAIYYDDTGEKRTGIPNEKRAYKQKEAQKETMVFLLK